MPSFTQRALNGYFPKFRPISNKTEKAAQQVSGPPPAPFSQLWERDGVKAGGSDPSPP
jgi:hypothetical protein